MALKNIILSHDLSLSFRSQLFYKISLIVIIKSMKILFLIPKKIVPKDQVWFWTKEWQKGEAEADEDIANVRLSKPFKTASALLKHLG